MVILNSNFDHLTHPALTANYVYEKGTGVDFSATSNYIYIFDSEFTYCKSNCVIIRGNSEKPSVRNVCTIKNCKFKRNLETPIKVDNSPIDWFEVQNSEFMGNDGDYSVELRACKAIKMVHNTFIGNRGFAILS